MLDDFNLVIRISLVRTIVLSSSFRFGFALLHMNLLPFKLLTQPIYVKTAPYGTLFIVLDFLVGFTVCGATRPHVVSNLLYYNRFPPEPVELKHHTPRTN